MWATPLSSLAYLHVRAMGVIVHRTRRHANEIAPWGCIVRVDERTKSNQPAHEPSNGLCQAIIEAEGTPMGPLLRAVNEIADVVAAKYV